MLQGRLASSSGPILCSRNLGDHNWRMLHSVVRVSSVSRSCVQGELPSWLVLGLYCIVMYFNVCVVCVVQSLYVA